MHRLIISSIPAVLLVIASLFGESISETTVAPDEVDNTPDIPPFTPVENRTVGKGEPSKCPCPSTSPNGTVAYCGHELVTLSNLTGADAEKCIAEQIYTCYEPSIPAVALRECRHGKHHKKGCGEAQDDHKWDKYMRACNIP